MSSVLLLNLVGLTPRLVGEHTPHLRAFAEEGALAPMSAARQASGASACHQWPRGMTSSGSAPIASRKWLIRAPSAAERAPWSPRSWRRPSKRTDQPCRRTRCSYRRRSAPSRYFNVRATWRQASSPPSNQRPQMRLQSTLSLAWRKRFARSIT